MPGAFPASYSPYVGNIMLKAALAALTALFMLAVVGSVPTTPVLISAAYEVGDPVLMGEIARAVNEVALEFSDVIGVTVTTEPLMSGVYAFAANPRIVFNTTYATDPNLFNRLVHKDVALDFHPDLGDCSPAEFLAFHEVAHIIDQKQDRIPRVRLMLLYGPGVELAGLLPGYAFVNGFLNHGEALAEAFAAVKCNGGNEAEREFYDILTENAPRR